MKKNIKALFSLLCTLMLISACSSSEKTKPIKNDKDISEENNNKETEKENDDIEIDDSKNNNDEVIITLDESSSYIYFGNYPQKEVVSVASDSGVYNKSWSKEDDYIIDTNLYNTLTSLSEDKWDNNNDTIIDDNKYRRIKSSDATYTTLDDINYYDWIDENTYHYFKYEPIKWKILNQEDNTTLLLSDIVLDDQKYNTEITNLTWETSTIRSWLNGYDSNTNIYGTDYTSNNFLTTAFTSNEIELINTTTIENKDNSKSSTEGGNDTNDKIFLLSEDEVYGDSATKYGFNSDYNDHDIARQAKSSTYAKAMGVYSECESDELANCFWWLRSPGSYTGLYILVRCNGSIYRGGQHANSKTRGVRPALYLNYDFSEKK